MAKGCTISYTFARNLYILFAFLVLLFEVFVVYPLTSTVTNQTDHRHLRIETSKATSIVMAKTVSTKDVNDTILDIESLRASLKERQFKLKWRIFCYEDETHQMLLASHAGDEKWRRRHSTEIFLEPGAHKNKFWHRHLNPKTIDTDYVWIMDGDIRLRNIAWECFWNIISRFKPSIFAPTIMASTDLEREKHKSYVGSTHPWHCYTDATLPKPNDMQRLLAMDVPLLEIQLPVFTRTAWQIIYNEFSNRVKGWGDFKTVWGPDQVWCSVIDHYLHNTNTSKRLQGRRRMPWHKAKTSCGIQKELKFNIETEGKELYYDEFNNQNYHHTCMLVHATPAEHLDTKSIKLYEENATEIFYEMGRRDRDEYIKAFEGFSDRIWKGHRHLYRAYMSDDPAKYNCQACKHAFCSSSNTNGNGTESESVSGSGSESYSSKSAE